VNAEPLDGETIHKALGSAWHGNDHIIDAQRILDLAKQAVQWRWLLIDEISMVSAEMLARLEARCRQLIMDLSATKYAKQSTYWVAPFGGLNVIFSGGLWQLPPPRGAFLGQIPRHRHFVQKIACEPSRPATRLGKQPPRRSARGHGTDVL